MEISISQVNPEEIHKVKELLSRTWKDTYSDFLSPQTIETVTSIWHKPENLLQQSQMKDIYFPIAKDKSGRIIGLATFRNTGERVLFMSRLYVDPQYQGQGIGSQLFEAGVGHFQGIQTIRLEVERQNEKAISFYKKQGFVQKESKQEKVGNETIEVIVMENQLS